MKRLKHSVDAEPALSYFEQERHIEPTQTLVSQKSRPANLVSDALVPLFHAAVTGLFAYLVTRFVFNGEEYAAGVGIIAAAIVWLVSIVQVARVIGAAEQLFQVDLNNDGTIGPAPTPPPNVIINSRRGGATVDPRTKKVKVEPAAVTHPFETFVRECQTTGTDMRNWAGLPRETYITWRNQLIRSGWATWNSYSPDGKPNTKQGWRLTATPDEILKECSIK